MNIDFKLPELGENIHSGDVVNVLVHEGESILANTGVVELETDKAVVEIPCPHAGTVSRLQVKKGDTVRVGQVLLTVSAGDGAGTAAKPASASKPAAPAKPAAVAKPAPATPQPPVVSAMVATQEPRVDLSSPGPEVAAESSPIPAGPAVRRLARELGVDLKHVQGLGKHGRITPEDVVAAAQPRSVAAPAAPGPTGSLPTGLQPVVPPGDQDEDMWGGIRRERISRIRRTIADQMSRSATTIPHVTNFDDADVTELERLRQGVAAGQLGQNIKLTVMPFVMKAVAMVLRRHPLLNASFDLEHEQIVYKEYVNLGVAIDTPRGLVVPSIRNADRLTILQLAQALSSIAQRARASQFTVEDLRGGTFTISNLGAVGGTYCTPIINYPESAILLLGRSRWMPIVRGENHDRIETRLMMPLSLSYDHRLVDGATAGRFLNEVIRNLETPGMLLLA